MDAETIVSLLGKRSLDPKVEEAFQSLGVMRRPELRIDPEDPDGPVVSSQDWVSNLSVGVEFGFQEERAFNMAFEKERNIGPMILTEVYFYGERPGTRAYPDPLPFGLSLEDCRSTVREKLALFEDTRRSYVRDTWEQPGYRMTVSYADDGARIDFIVCMLRSEALMPCENDQEGLPSVSTMVDLFGKRSTDRSLQQALRPFGPGRKATSRGGVAYFDFRQTHGVKLSFRRFTERGKTPEERFLLCEVEFPGVGELEACRWRGGLPFGIEFDESPETVLTKVGQAPSHQRDDDFYGEVFWKFSDYSLQVTYSTMENVVLSVRLLEPNM